MFYDLNVPWSPNDTSLPRTLAFLHELGYNVIALNHSITGKLPADLTCPIPNPLPIKDIPPTLTVLRRCTLTLTISHQNARLASLASNYDILALRPIDEKTLTLACTSLDCDIISLDLTQRLPFWLKHKTLTSAIREGKRFEISYAQGVLGSKEERRNVISNATQLIRACRGRGIVLSSEAKITAGLRGPWDVVNLAAVWGLSQERGYEGVSKECRSVVVSGRLKRTGWRGAVDVVYGGEKPDAVEDKGQAGQKRKAEVIEEGQDGTASGASENGVRSEKPMSKRALKRQKKALMQAASNGETNAPGGANTDNNTTTLP